MYCSGSPAPTKCWVIQMHSNFGRTAIPILSLLPGTSSRTTKQEAENTGAQQHLPGKALPSPDLLGGLGFHAVSEESMTAAGLGVGKILGPARGQLFPWLPRAFSSLRSWQDLLLSAQQGGLVGSGHSVLETLSLLCNRTVLSSSALPRSRVLPHLGLPMPCHDLGR